MTQRPHHTHQPPASQQQHDWMASSQGAPAAAAAVTTSGNAAPAAPAADSQQRGDLVLEHLSSVCASAEETWVAKLSLLNQLFAQARDFPLHAAAFAEYLQLYPQILQQCAAEVHADSDMMRACVQSVQEMARALTRDPAGGGGGREAVLLALGRLLGFVLHSHALVSEFFAAQWRLLHAGNELPGFESWSTRVLVHLLADSGAITDPEDANATSQLTWQTHQQWHVNHAQAKVIELLAQLAPTLTLDNQMFLFRHFNLLLQSSAAPFSPSSFDPSHQLPFAVQSAFILSVPIDQLHADIQQVLYMQTLPCCLHELDLIRLSGWHSHLDRLPVLMYCLEMLLGLFKAPTNAATPSPLTPPTAAHPSLTTAAPTAAATLHALVVTIGGTFCNAEVVVKLPGEAFVAVMRALFACLQCEAIGRCVTAVQWTSGLAQLRRMCDSHPAMRDVLGDVLVGLAGLRLSPEAADAFFTKTLQPLFHFLLASPAPTAATTATPAGSLPPLPEHACLSFYRFSLACAGWTPRLKELIPPTVHARLVAFVQARGKHAAPIIGPTMRPLMLATSSSDAKGKPAADLTPSDLARFQAEWAHQGELLTAFSATPAMAQRRQTTATRVYAAISHASILLQ